MEQKTALSFSANMQRPHEPNEQRCLETSHARWQRAVVLLHCFLEETLKGG